MRDHDPTTATELLMHVARAMRRQMGEALAGWDLTPAQARALRVVEMAEAPPRLSQIAERLRIVPRSATEVVDALADAGLVVREPDPADRRATCVRLTDRGVEVARLLRDARATGGEAFLSARLNAAERTELARLLAKLLE